MVSLEKYYEPQRKLRLVGILESMREEKIERGKQLIVKSVKDDVILARLLQQELFPSIPCAMNVI